MHRAFYTARRDAGALVHLHSMMATAVTGLPDVDAINPIPPLTPYFVMRIGRRLPIVPYLSARQSPDGGCYPQRCPRCPRGAAR